MNPETILARLAAAQARAAWRLARIYRPGTVAEYDPERHRARVRIAPDGIAGGLGPWAPVQEARGFRTTLAPGDPVWLFSPNGDLRLAVVQLGAFSDASRPDASGTDETSLERGPGRVSITPDRARMTFGGAAIELSDGSARLSLGGGSVEIDAAGQVRINA